MKIQSYRMSKSGSLNNLKLINEELPEIAPNEVCIEIKAIGLNFADVFTILGLYKAAPKRNFIPGLEFSGTIIKKGNDVHDYQINDNIMGVIRFGSFTSHLNIDYRYVQKLPAGDKVSFRRSFIKPRLLTNLNNVLLFSILYF